MAKKNPLKKKTCLICAEQLNVDYKDVNLLRRFMSPYGRIFSRKRTGNCAKHQRQITKAIKRARHLALLPFTTR